MVAVILNLILPVYVIKEHENNIVYTVTFLSTDIGVLYNIQYIQ